MPSSESRLLQEILGAFFAKPVNLAELPAADPLAGIGNLCETLFTHGVDTLRSIIPNERVRSLARVVWGLVEHKQVLVGLGPDVPSLSFAAMRRGVEDKGPVVVPEDRGLVVAPKTWPQMVDADPLMQLGAILFVGAQVVDFCNGRLFGEEDEARVRWHGYEAELLLTLQRILPSWRPNDYQRQVLERYPGGLDAPGVVLYPYRTAPENAP